MIRPHKVALYKWHRLIVRIMRWTFVLRSGYTCMPAVTTVTMITHYLLFQFENVMIEKLVKFLIRVVYTHLFERVHLDT